MKSYKDRSKVKMNSGNVIHDKRLWEVFQPCSSKSKFVDNTIMTSKYTIIGLLPRFVFEQFMDIRMQFFMFASVASHANSSPVSYMSPFLALFFLETFIFIVEIYNELKRRKYDKRENSRLVYKYCPLDDEFIAIRNEKICVGDIIILFNNMQFPADVVVIKSSHYEGNLFVSTSSLDGESGIKERFVFKDKSFNEHFMDLEQYIVGRSDTIKHMKLSKKSIYKNNMLGFQSHSSPISICLKNNKNSSVDIFDESSIQNLLNIQCSRTCPEPSHIKSISQQIIQIDDKIVDRQCTVFRGSILRHTKAVICLVTYTGHDTMMMNSTENFSPKFTHINLLIDMIILLMIGICLFGTIFMSLATHFYNWMIKNHSLFWFDESIFVGYFILFFTFTPLSFYTMKMIAELIFVKQLQYDAKLARRPQVNNPSALSHAGGINLICSDKTGTLTCNSMVLKYLIFCNNDNLLTFLPINDNSTLTYDYILQNLQLINMIQCILLCNSASLNPEFSLLNNDTKTPALEYYLCTNQDDETLLLGLLDKNIKIEQQSADKVILKIMSQCNKFLRTNIAIDPDGETFFQVKVFKDHFGKYRAFMKGAPEVLLNFINEFTIPQNYEEELTKSNSLCYRVLSLCVAEFDHLPNRSELLTKNFYNFLGMTAVEDKLSSDVEDTIKALSFANIKTIIITGDNDISAHNIAKKSGIINDNTDICKFEPKKPYEFNLDHIQRLASNEYGILDANMIRIALEDPEIFMDKVKFAKTIVYSRATAAMKSRIVECYKNVKGFQVLAIGDGFNDVSMIKNAHLGIGLSGKEGKMAYNTSDIGLHSFKDLKRLLLIHGHKWNEGMIEGTSALYFKSIFYIMMMLMFCITSRFEIILVFESFSLVLYNGFIMLLPIIIIYTCNHSLSEDELLSNPFLYADSYPTNSRFSRFLIFGCFSGSTQALIAFIILRFITLSSGVAFNTGKMMDLPMVKSISLIVSNLYLSIYYLSKIHHWNFMKFILLSSPFWTNLLYLSLIGDFLPKFGLFLDFTSILSNIFSQNLVYISLFNIVCISYFANFFIYSLMIFPYYKHSKKQLSQFKQ